MFDLFYIIIIMILKYFFLFPFNRLKNFKTVYVKTVFQLSTIYNQIQVQK